ncbi:hypothetical protein HJC23_011746 [Cyclotella cryptica]|uniref:HIT domain-containing protein n=1 Tax=Cyclotella cryptica TaxID=29204 RepID=A0ABD3PGN2_9STRA|eukprot:CCRYP_014801-RA/>CCRYP_014801-RA protein AED:0.01 eAED:0.01 QI:277/1/1/1/1/1/2/696/613
MDDAFVIVPPLSYRPPNANDFPESSSWRDALFNILSLIETTNDSSRLPIVLFKTDKYVCMYDKFPKAKYHCLLMPRRQRGEETIFNTVETLNDVTPYHSDELREFHILGKNIARRLQESIQNTSDSVQITIKLGYHAIPSLKPLHLHIVSSDLDSSYITRRNHVQSFTSSSFFVTPDALENHLESAFVSLHPPMSLFVDVRMQRAQSILESAPMKCTKCDRVALNVPDWKRHNQYCTAMLKQTRSKGSLNSLLGWCSREYYGVAASRNPNFVKEINHIGFSIFLPQRDLGYYSWGSKHVPYKPLRGIESEDEILRCINVSDKPARLKPIIGQQVEFQSPTQAVIKNTFPYGQIMAAGLYVASMRGIDINATDFCFGGSVLGMLATRNSSGTFIASFIPGTRCILVVNREAYSENLASSGFQFERYATGKDMNDTVDTTTVNHLHTMRVGAKNVLFITEVHAVDETDSPIEIMASDPVIWGLNILLQMISSGSSRICYGQSDGQAIKNISLQSLSSVAQYFLQQQPCADIQTFEQNILSGMRDIAAQLVDGRLYRVNFSLKNIELVPEKDPIQCAVLPRDSVATRLIHSIMKDSAGAFERKRRLSEVDQNKGEC